MTVYTICDVTYREGRGERGGRGREGTEGKGSGHPKFLPGSSPMTHCHPDYHPLLSTSAFCCVQILHALQKNSGINVA